MLIKFTDDIILESSRILRVEAHETEGMGLGVMVSMEGMRDPIFIPNMRVRDFMKRYEKIMHPILYAISYGDDDEP